MEKERPGPVPGILVVTWQTGLVLSSPSGVLQVWVS